MFAFPSPIWFALVWMAAIICMFQCILHWWPHFVVVEEDVHMAPQRLRWALQNLVGAWLHHSPMIALVHHRSNLAAPEFLQIVAHNFVVHLLLGRGRTFSYNPSSFIFLHRHKKSFLRPIFFPSRKSLIFHPEGANSPCPL
jgi:hypothetical protein